MSRSIHTTIAKLVLEQRHDFSDDETKRSRIGKMREEINTKRMIKRRKQLSRQHGQPLMGMNQPFNIESVTITVADLGQYIHYPASREDVIGIAKRLPQNVMAGIHSLTFCLGKEYQAEEWEEKYEPQVDPFTGRICYDGEKQIYTPPVLGVYYSKNCKIFIFAYVYDEQLPNPGIIRAFYRLKMLATVVHEIAHHDDFMRRCGKGRWFCKNEYRCENYAEIQAGKWLETAVFPYLWERYPAEYADLLNWIRVNGGVEFSLIDLVEEPNIRGADGLTRLVINSKVAAVGDMISNVGKGMPPLEVMLEFAYDLHYADHYEDCLKSLDQILTLSPQNAKALGLKADTLSHLEKLEEAEKAAQACLAIDPANLEALDVMCDLYRERGDWQALRQTSSCGIGNAGENHPRSRFFIEQHLIASLYLGDWVTAQADVAALPEKRPGHPEKKRVLGALVTWFAGNCEDALRIFREIIAEEEIFYQAKAIAKAVLLKTLGDYGGRVDKASLVIGELEESFLSSSRIGELIKIRSVSERDSEFGNDI